MGEKIRRFASFVGPPWVWESEQLPDEPVRGTFTGLWTRLYVTDHWVIICSPTRDFALRLADVASVEAGFDPSPHDSGGPVWWIWITTINRQEHGAQISQPYEAAALIRSRIQSARRDEASRRARESEAPEPDAPGWKRV